jgi:hypothetical protein
VCFYGNAIFAPTVVADILGRAGGLGQSVSEASHGGRNGTGRNLAGTLVRARWSESRRGHTPDGIPPNEAISVSV